MDNSKHVFDYFCNSLSFKVDVFASCEQDKGNVLMRQKQLIFQMMEYPSCVWNVFLKIVKTNASGTTWFAKKDLRLAAITMSFAYWKN